MRFLEKVLIVLFIIGFFIRAFHMPGNILILLGGILLALLYMAFSWLLFRQPDKRSNIAVTLLAGFALGLMVLGMQFKLLIWTGANPLLATSAVVLLGLTIASLVSLRRQLRIGFYKAVLSRTVPYLLVGTILLFITPVQWIRLFHRDDPEYVRLFSLYYEHPENQEYARQFQLYRMHQAGVSDEAIREYNKAHPSAEDSF